jgi:hypothetical protein
MTRRSLRSLLLRIARVLDDAARKQQPPAKLISAAKELRDAAAKGIRA